MKNIYNTGGQTPEDVSEEMLKLLQGIQAAQDKAEESFDPYKGRTFIPRMSPDMKKMLVESIRKARLKGTERKLERIKKRKTQEMREKGIPEMELSKRQERLFNRLEELKKYE